MYVRCADCTASTRVEIGQQERGVTCQVCGRDYSLRAAGKLGATPAERFATAQAFADANGIDLASAYSIMLGFLSLERARAFQPEPALPEGEHDPGYQKAISENRLTVRQAIERGDRVAFASRVARKHRLPMHLAFDVADNRRSVGEAVRANREAKQKLVVNAVETFSPWRKIGAPALVLVIVGAVGGLVRNGDARPENAMLPLRATTITRAPVLAVSSSVKLDPGGRVTQVVDRDASSVLESFCAAGRGEILREPFALKGAGDERIGYYREEMSVYAIRIRRDENTGRWVAGDGVSLLRGEPVSEVPEP